MSVRRFSARRRRHRRNPLLRLLDVLLAVAVLTLVGLVAMRFDRPVTRSLSGTVVVNDGDTLTLAGERIRLRGIDAPEWAQLCERDGQAYACGEKAADALRELVAGGPVVCSGWERDRYDRLLARCKAQGEDIGQSMVRAGWAVAYGDYHLVQARARAARLGMWAGEFDRPSDWRASHGAAAGRQHDWYGRLLNWLRQAMGLR